MKSMKKILLLVLFAAFFAGCDLFSGISYENDDVMKTQRYRFETNFSDNQRHEQKYLQNITILKEKNKNGKYQQ